jgi:VWFA-related protein
VRVVVIVLDDAHIGPEMIPLAQRSARAVVDALGPHDIAAVKYTWMGRDQDMTTDRRRLLAAVDSLIPHSGTAAPGPMTAGARGSISAVRPFSALSAGSPVGGAPLGCAFRGAGGCVLDAMTHIAEALADAPQGRKTLVYISPSAPAPIDLSRLKGSNDYSQLMELFERFQRANVNVYPIDPVGLSVGEGIIGPRLDGLRALAENTGGRATVAVNTPWQDVPQIFRENSAFYMLDFRSSQSTTDGAFHRLEVKVNRPDAEVRARNGYFAPKTAKAKPSARPAPAVSPVDRALGGALPARGLPIGVSVTPIAASDRTGAAVITVVVDDAGLDASRQVEIVASAFDLDNYDEKTTSRQTVAIPASSGRAAHEVPARLDLPPGRYEVRVAAASGAHSGSIITDVEIPDVRKERLSASGLVIGSGRWASTAARRLLEPILPVAPTTNREFSRSDAATIFVRLYQAAGKPASAVRIDKTVTDRTGARVVEDTATIDAARFVSAHAADLEWALPLSTLAPGEYLVGIDAATGGVTLHRDTRITVK